MLKCFAQHIEQLRALHQLRCLTVQADKLSLPALLAPPHQLQQLTSLRVSDSPVDHIDYVASMPVLTALAVQFDASGVLTPRVFAALSACTQLVSLELTDGDSFPFTSEDLVACLPHLPHLRELTLKWCTRLTSLAFLRAGLLPFTLTALSIDMFKPELALQELHELLHLRALTSLTLGRRICSAPLDAATLRLFTPPSHALPALRSFTCGGEVRAI